jgi:MoaA/NifB/PqqE/SkfB family radical SAM enzyme
VRTPRQLRRDGLLYLSRALNRSLAPPDRVSVNVTLRCNLTCSMCTTCYDAPEMSTREIKDIIDQTAAWGVEIFNPLGGEPFMRADIEELLGYAVHRGFYVTVTTNATLITEKRARAIARVPSDRLHFNVSLDGSAKSNDQVRGAGMWARAIEGVRRIRAADAAAGNARRKILANTILHARNISEFEDVLDEQATLGFDGVRILNLFRQGDDVPPEAATLWFHDHHIAELERATEALAVRAETQGPVGYRIQNPPDELRRIPRYYTQAMTPLEAPCWAGWKELYINADGRAIMCDGELDFLAGAFGDVRKQTLQELWTHPVLKQRRQVVKSCSRPCNQECYLRGSSDSVAEIGLDAVRNASQGVLDRARRSLRRVQHFPEMVLRVELSDVCPCGWAGCRTPQSRWTDLVARAPDEPTAETWARLRDRHYVDFGRGFMGFEVVRKVVADLLASRIRPGTLAVTWRGEPLLHPQAEPILQYLLDRVHTDGLADRLRVETSGVFLTESIADLAGHPARQDWVLDLTRGEGAGLALLQARRGADCRVVLATHAEMGLDYAALAARYPAFPAVVGAFPDAGDALWIRRTDHGHYLGDQEARAELEAAAQAVGVSPDLAPPSARRRCVAADRTPTVSWDGKVTLCPWDVRLDNRVGDVISGTFSEYWGSPRRAQDAQDAAGTGAPNRALCRDCGQPWSPNHPY